MRYASVCDGIGAAHVAWQPLGWRCAWTSEIDPFPAAVVDHHWNLPNLGDMTTINAKDAIDEHGAIDLLVGGTPCQSFSVAGLRKGLRDPRGNLALVYLGHADALRPRWVVWENVPGVLSSNGGRDFGAFLGALGELGYGWAYRVLDAQYVRVESHPRAVPQRRRRVFVVGYLGDWRAPAGVLLERESMRGDPAPRRRSGQSIAEAARAGAPQPHEVGNTLTARMHKGINTTLDEGQTPIVAFDTTQITHPDNRSNPKPDAPSPTRGKGTHPPAIAFCNTAGETGLGICTEHAPPVTARKGDPGMVAFGFKRGQGAKARSLGYGPISPTLTASDSGTQQSPGVVRAHSVRRLTPRECERLQGFPDDYTLINYRNKPAKDTPRYKALGNSMAINCMTWIGQRIELVESIGRTSP